MPLDPYDLIAGPYKIVNSGPPSPPSVFPCLLLNPEIIAYTFLGLLNPCLNNSL